MSKSDADLRRILNDSELLWGERDIHSALDSMAAQLNERYAGSTPLILCVMNGGIVTTGHLTTRLRFFPEIGYLHVSRYRGTTAGGELTWRAQPVVDISGRDVILVDDIFDEGWTLAAIDRYCRERGAASICTVVLVDKIHDRKVDGFRPDVIGLTVDDRYVFGFGMDYEEYFRNLSAIHALG